ncbi:hypothetical protein D9M69_528720 [compost metagenome]
MAFRGVGLGGAPGGHVLEGVCHVVLAGLDAQVAVVLEREVTALEHADLAIRQAHRVRVALHLGRHHARALAFVLRDFRPKLVDPGPQGFDEIGVVAVQSGHHRLDALGGPDPALFGEQRLAVAFVAQVGHQHDHLHARQAVIDLGHGDALFTHAAQLLVAVELPEQVGQGLVLGLLANQRIAPGDLHRRGDVLLHRA